MQKIFTFSFLLLFVFKTACAQNPVISIAQWPSSTTSFTYPVLVTNCGDSRKFVVQRTGAIYIVDSAGNKLTTPFLNISSIITSTQNEQGLLGLAFDPDYATNGNFYVYYTATPAGGSSGDNTLAGYHVSANPNIADASSGHVLYHVNDPYWNHNGGNLVFGPDGYLYISMGDGGSGGDPGNRAQNKTLFLGKIHRIDVHDTSYSIPSTNPFYGSATYNQTIWDYGVRNPWRCNFDPITHDFWIADVGQNTYEEIDFEPAGNTGGINYGWHCREGLHTYSSGAGDCNGTVGLTDPIFEYAHSGGACSITGGYVYRGALHQDMWGRYYFIDYCTGNLQSLRPNGSGAWINDNLGTFNTYTFGSFGQDNEGELYLCAHDNNKVYKITSADNTPVAYILQQDTVNICAGSSLTALYNHLLSYQWQLNNSDIAGANSSVYTPTSTGNYRVIVMHGSDSDTSAETFVANIFSLPTVTMSYSAADSILCPNDAPVTLTGNPIGGTFSGTGVSGNTFNPAGLSYGMTTVDYMYTDNHGCSNTAHQDFSIQFCLGVNSFNVATNSKIFPNPNNGQFSLSVQLLQQQEITVEIFNTLGQKVLEKTTSLPQGISTLPLNLTNVSRGVYHYTIKGNKSVMNGSFTIE